MCSYTPLSKEHQEKQFLGDFGFSGKVLKSGMQDTKCYAFSSLSGSKKTQLNLFPAQSKLEPFGSSNLDILVTVQTPILPLCRKLLTPQHQEQVLIGFSQSIYPQPLSTFGPKAHQSQWKARFLLLLLRRRSGLSSPWVLPGDPPLLWNTAGRHKEALGRLVVGGGKFSNGTADRGQGRELESTPFPILADVWATGSQLTDSFCLNQFSFIHLFEQHILISPYVLDTHVGAIGVRFSMTRTLNIILTESLVINYNSDPFLAKSF